MIFGLTSLGVVHTAISLVAVAAGFLIGAAPQARRLHSRPSP